MDKKMKKDLRKIFASLLIIFIGPAIVLKAWNGHLLNIVNGLPVLTYWATFWLLMGMGVIGNRLFKKVKV